MSNFNLQLTYLKHLTLKCYPSRSLSLSLSHEKASPVEEGKKEPIRPHIYDRQNSQCYAICVRRAIQYLAWIWSLSIRRPARPTQVCNRRRKLLSKLGVPEHSTACSTCLLAKEKDEALIASNAMRCANNNGKKESNIKIYMNGIRPEPLTTYALARSLIQM